jgi:hypothetical protein
LWVVYHVQSSVLLLALTCSTKGHKQLVSAGVMCRQALDAVSTRLRILHECSAAFTHVYRASR